MERQKITNAPYGRALQFNGTDQYLKQKVQDTNQGALTYSGINDTNTALFEDFNQMFLDWITVTGDAKYLIQITNTDSSITWGYIGEASLSLNECIPYQDIETDHPWVEGDTPNNRWKSPVILRNLGYRAPNFG